MEQPNQAKKLKTHLRRTLSPSICAAKRSVQQKFIRSTHVDAEFTNWDAQRKRQKILAHQAEQSQDSRGGMS